MARFSRAWAVDTIERVAATFVETAAGALVLDLVTEPAVVASTGQDVLTVARGAALAGLAAAAALVKTIAAGFIGRATSASLLPDDVGPVGSTGTPYP